MNNTKFINKGNHERGNESCPARNCFPYNCECGGLIHTELVDHYYSIYEEDYFGLFDHFCDKCNKYIEGA